MIPQSFIQDLLARIDIVDVIARYIPLKKSGANYFACCPFHGEKSASFSVSPSKQFYYCFGCGAHGSAIGFLMEYSNLDFVEAVKTLASQAGMQVPQTSALGQTTPHYQHSNTLFDVMDTATRFYQQQLKNAPFAIEYLKHRGLSGPIAARYGLGYAPNDKQALKSAFSDYQSETLLEAGLVIDKDQHKRYDRFRNRIIFPIHDRRGRIIALGGRILDQGSPKYLNSPETPLFEKGRELYGLFLAQKAIRSVQFALVVEGYMDVVALAQFGIENVVATLGTATSTHQIHTLLKQTDRIVFCFDGDAAGRKAAWRALENALEVLRDDATLAFLFLPEGHDPDSFIRNKGTTAFLEAAQKATPLAQFLLQELTASSDLESAEGRARLVHEARPLITQISAPVLRLQILKTIAQTSQLTQAEIEHAYNLQQDKRSIYPKKGSPPSRTRSHNLPLSHRKSPSAIATLLRLVLQQPIWAARLPIGLIPDNSAEGRALIALVDLTSLGELIPSGGIGTLIEHFRNTPHSETFARIAREQIDTEFDEEIIETLFEDALLKLQTDALANEFAELLNREKEGRLSPGERNRLAQLLLAQRELSLKKKRGNIV